MHCFNMKPYKKSLPLIYLNCIRQIMHEYLGLNHINSYILKYIINLFRDELIEEFIFLTYEIM